MVIYCPGKTHNTHISHKSKRENYYCTLNMSLELRFYFVKIKSVLFIDADIQLHFITTHG